MAFNVRIYGHSGIVPMKIATDPGQQHTDSVFQLKQPYVWTQGLSVTSTAVASAAPVTVLSPYNGDISSVLRIEVPDGQSIRYEINPPAISRVAGASSPKMSGVDQFEWGTGWTISIVDASSFP